MRVYLIFVIIYLYFSTKVVLIQVNGKALGNCSADSQMIRILLELERKVLFMFQDCSGRVSRYLMRSERVFALDFIPSLCLNSSS